MRAQVECEAGSVIIWGNNTWHVAYPRKIPGLRLTLGPVLFVKPGEVTAI